MIDRAGLADFLRRRRAQLGPADVGLPDGARRRTAGLRREEVAMLAGISVDYYSRLEQGRGPHPSEPIVASLAQALRCRLDERDHLYHLAGLLAPQRRAGRHLGPELVALVERLTDVPVMVCTDLEEVLWQNALADAALGRWDPEPGRGRNLTWLWFTQPAVRGIFPEEDWPYHTAAHVADLRATYSRRSGERDVVALVGDLLEASAEFRHQWERHEVGVRLFDRKRVVHPEVGILHLTSQVLLTPEGDLRVRSFLPTDGTDAREKLELLRVVGTRQFSSPSSDR